MGTNWAAPMVILLLAIPAGGAIVVALIGPRGGNLIRWLSAGTTIATAVISLLLALEYAKIAGQSTGRGAATFQPEMVPGAAAANPHSTSWNLLEIGPKGAAVQFYVGID